MSAFWPDGTSGPNPVEWRVTSEFGPRQSFWTPNGWTASFHYGMDFGHYWDQIAATFDGVVTFAGYNGGAGNEVRLREDGTGDVVRLMHHREIWVRQGQRVVGGKTIVGLMGTTGNSDGTHSHFEIHPGGGAAVNPRGYMRARNLSGSGAGSPGRPIVTPQLEEEMPWIAIVGSGDYYLVSNNKAILHGKGAIVAAGNVPQFKFADQWAIDNLKTAVSGIK